MSAFGLAWSFIRVRKLFVSLLLWPLVIGLFVAAAQVVFTAAYIKTINKKSIDIERMIEGRAEATVLRSLLYGTSVPDKSIKVCRWQMVNKNEQPPSGDCAISNLDVVVRVTDPQTFDAKPYVELYSGAVERIHFCQTCSSLVIVDRTKDEPASHLYSLKGLGVFALRDAQSSKLTKKIVQAFEEKERMEVLEGTVFLHPRGIAQPINFSSAEETMALIVNISLMIVITLWLALKAHRKILDYFARNDALLPLVAACGKQKFYNALWIITLLRVSFFLIASVPATFLVFTKVARKETVEHLLADKAAFILWLICIISSLTCIAIIASISELKHRQAWHNILYKYVPTIACVLGATFWLICVFNVGGIFFVAQEVIAALPIIGTSPVILSPIIRLNDTVLSIHAISSCALIIWLVRSNSRWFAAHLEEL